MGFLRQVELLGVAGQERNNATTLTCGCPCEKHEAGFVQDVLGRKKTDNLPRRNCSQSYCCRNVFLEQLE
jgi:hypothetical protein